MKVSIWIGMAMVIGWGILWLGVKMAIAAVHLLLLLGVALIIWGFISHGRSAGKRAPH